MEEEEQRLRARLRASFKSNQRIGVAAQSGAVTGAWGPEVNAQDHHERQHIPVTQGLARQPVQLSQRASSSSRLSERLSKNLVKSD